MGKWPAVRVRCGDGNTARAIAPLIAEEESALILTRRIAPGTEIRVAAAHEGRVIFITTDSYFQLSLGRRPGPRETWRINISKHFVGSFGRLAKTTVPLLSALLIAIAAPQWGWTQPTEKRVEKQVSAEGNRLLAAGTKLYRAGQCKEAASTFEQARAVYSRELGDEHTGTLFAMNNIAVCYNELGQYDKALALNESLLRIRRANLGEGHPDTLGSMVNLGATYSFLGMNAKAVAINELTLKTVRAKLGDDQEIAFTLMGNLAISFIALGQFDKALSLNAQALALKRAKLGNDNPSTLNTMTNLAVSFESLGQYDKAMGLEEETILLKRNRLGKDHPSTLASMSNLAGFYLTTGDAEKALALNEQVLQLRRSKLGDEHPDTLTSIFNNGRALLELGRYEKAVPMIELAFRMRRTKLGDDHPDTLTSMSTLAFNYGLLGMHEKALALNEQVFQLRRVKLGLGHRDSLKSMFDLASNYRDTGQHQKALAIIPDMLRGAENLRALSGLSTEQRQSLFGVYSDDYQKGTNYYASQGQLTDAFDLGDLSKARTLTDSIKAQSALRALPQAEQEQVQLSQARALYLQGRVDKLNEQTKVDTASVLAAQKELEDHNKQHLQLVQDLKARFVKFARLTDLKPATVADAKRLLKAGEVFVSYLVQSKGDAQAFIIDAKGEPQWLNLGKLSNLNQTIAAYRELLSPTRDDSAQGRLVAFKDGGYQWLLPGQASPKDAQFAASGTQEGLKLLSSYLHDKLIKPVLPLAGSYPRWIISPDKDLALLPFDTLPEAIGADGQIGQNLAQLHNLTLVQSFAVYALLKEREMEYAQLAHRKDLLAMGNAVYSDGWAANRGMQRASGSRGFEPKDRNRTALVLASADGAALGALKPSAEQYALSQGLWMNLPGTAREVNAVAQAFGAGGKSGDKVDTYFGLEASEGKLLELNRQGKLRDYRYLLFSAHGYLAQNPALSALVLSQQGNPPEIDGYVTASEWPLYDIKSDLTVLSACDTGVGKIQAGEGVMGLPYALFVAGNKNTLLSLWPVDDDATAEFMSRFFAKLKAGTNQPEALTQTKREFMGHARWAPPRYWAAFVMYGV